MIMADKDKGMASIIVGKLSGPEKETEAEEKDEDVAVEEIMAALKADDKEKFKEALESFIHMCFMEMESEPHEEADSEEHGAD